jgi:hypothetical protein
LIAPKKIPDWFGDFFCPAIGADRRGVVGHNGQLLILLGLGKV